MTFPNGTDFGLTDKDGNPLLLGDRFLHRKEYPSTANAEGRKVIEWTGLICWDSKNFRLCYVDILSKLIHPLSSWYQNDKDGIFSLEEDFIPYITKIQL